MLVEEKGNILVIRDTVVVEEKSRFSYGDGSIDNMQVSPDGRLVVLEITRFVNDARRSEIRCFDLTTGRQQAAFLQAGWDLQSFAFVPDSHFLVSGHGNTLNEGGEIKVWDLEAKRLLWKSRSHRRPVKHLAISPDGKRLASADEVEVKLWDLVTHQELITLPGSYPVYFSPDGRTMLSPAGSDHLDIRIWRAATDDELNR